MTSNFTLLRFSTLYSSPLWRTDTIVFAKLNKPPPSQIAPRLWPKSEQNNTFAKTVFTRKSTPTLICLLRVLIANCFINAFDWLVASRPLKLFPRRGSVARNWHGISTTERKGKDGPLSLFPPYHSPEPVYYAFPLTTEDESSLEDIYMYIGDKYYSLSEPLVVRVLSNETITVCFIFIFSVLWQGNRLDDQHYKLSNAMVR